ncbi:hypothetical protein TNCV_780801 [Trichonephila clavipes]|nr:hypothetical protein TNCV_780801 [Trichonephila clavipes]
MWGLFEDPLNDDIYAEQLSGYCRSDKTVLSVKPDLFFLDALNSRQAFKSSREVGRREKRWADTDPDILCQNWGGIELNSPVTCMVLKATDNNRRICSPLS